MRDFNLNMIGRFGNMMFQYAFARTYCRIHGFTLRCDPWIGQQLFDLPTHPMPDVKPEHVKRYSEMDVPMENPPDQIWFTGYCQSKRAIIYNNSELREMFKVSERNRVKIRECYEYPDVAFHIRRGDFAGYGYPLVSLVSYDEAYKHYGFAVTQPVIVHEEDPHTCSDLPDWITDWLLLYYAENLFRANSSFSFWAAELGTHKRIFSPMIEGLKGGEIHDTIFVEGNWPRLAALDMCDEFRIPP